MTTLMIFGMNDNVSLSSLFYRWLSCRLFDELRKTKTVSAFPVGIVGGQFVSTPLLDENGKFVRFFEGWTGGRKYALDMAGFAVSVEQYVKVKMKYLASLSYLTQLYVLYLESQNI